MKRLLALLAVSLAGLASAAELPRTGFLGVQLVAADGKGARVQALVDGGSAKAVGLEKDDIVTRVNGAAVASPADAVAQVAKLHAGDRIVVGYERAGSAREGSGTVQPRPYESSPDAETRYGAVEARGALQRTIMTLPRSPGRHPAVLYITGIGCFSQEDASLRSNEANLLYGLTRSGFATLRVEKSGIVDSRGAACGSEMADLRNEMAGYAAGLESLKQDPSVDPRRIYVMGTSIGGVEAPIVAQAGGVKGIVVINTVARPFLEYLYETRRRQLSLAKVPFDEIDRRIRLNERCNHDALIEGRATGPECADTIEYPASLAYMRQWAAIDPAAEWKKVDAPVLIVHGGMDYVATGDTDAPYLRDIVESFHPGHATLVRIDGMNHWLDRVATMEESLAKGPGGPPNLEPSLLPAIAGWLRQQG